MISVAFSAILALSSSAIGASFTASILNVNFAVALCPYLFVTFMVILSVPL